MSRLPAPEGAPHERSECSPAPKAPPAARQRRPREPAASPYPLTVRVTVIG